ncbi:MAG TPA: hypothetical protein DCY37_04040 [Acidaminococcaceae bacterium]|nr:hypothetical protein [Acidaminococcaceae bacterium]
MKFPALFCDFLLTAAGRGGILRTKVNSTTKPKRRRSSHHKRLQRVRGAESRVERLVGQWTVEGVPKSQESIAQRSACVKGEGCVGILQRARSFRESRWYRR